jgi:hypothetical protein
MNNKLYNYFVAQTFRRYQNIVLATLTSYYVAVVIRDNWSVAHLCSYGSVPVLVDSVAHGSTCVCFSWLRVSTYQSTDEYGNEKKERRHYRTLWQTKVWAESVN